ncbi:DUF2381 family protein, partial [Pyxidicoccus sp. 3LG]
ELGAENARLREENARLRAARARPEGLVGMWVAGELGWEGVPARWLGNTVQPHAKNPLGLRGMSTFRAKAGLMVVVELLKLPVAQPWRAEAAALVAPDGTALRVEQVWQEAEIPPGGMQYVLVAVEAMADLPPGPYTLTLWAAGGKRAVILRNVTFP